ncbi:MAG TPA: right-handed parallel beta-helix repeat-containing protein [Mycobacteriales bacterium]|nr:right-handed parallel beta-helix repeat-containing protein [Mycobacteriales bacterium]
MRRICGAILVALFVAAVPAAASGTSPKAATAIYVAPGGDDAGPGTLARPFATPQRAQQAVRANSGKDVVVNFRGGTYSLSRPLEFTAADSGLPGHRVVYQAFGYGTAFQERVVFSGGRPVSGWRPAGHGIWRADVGGLETRQVYANGRRLHRAALGAGLPGHVTRTGAGFRTDSVAPQSWRRPQDIEFVHTYADGYSEGRCGVAGISGDRRGSTITMDQPCFHRADQIYASIIDGAHGFAPPTDIQNSPSFLTAPGRWYLDRSRPGHHVLLIRTRGAAPSGIVAATRTGLIRGAGVHDLMLRGFTFAYTTWLGPDRPAGFPHIIGTWYYIGDDPAKEKATAIPGTVDFDRAQRVVIEGNRFVHLGNQALEFQPGSRDLTVRGNLFDDISAGAVQIEGPGKTPVRHRGSVVENNRVQHIGVEYHGSWGILLDEPHDSTIRHNLVQHVPYSGIVFLNSGGDSTTASNTKVIGNRVVDTNNVLIDGGPIYANGPQGPSFADGALIAGNVVSDSTNPVSVARIYPPYAIYTDDGADNVTVRNNAIFRNQRGLGGVAPGRVRFTGNFWDDDSGVWWGAHEQVAISGNTRLPDAHPEAACRKDRRCRAILAGTQR